MGFWSGFYQGWKDESDRIERRKLFFETMGFDKEKFEETKNQFQQSLAFDREELDYRRESDKADRAAKGSAGSGDLLQAQLKAFQELDEMEKNINSEAAVRASHTRQIVEKLMVDPDIEEATALRAANMITANTANSTAFLETVKEAEEKAGNLEINGRKLLNIIEDNQLLPEGLSEEELRQIQVNGWSQYAQGNFQTARESVWAAQSPEVVTGLGIGNYGIPENPFPEIPVVTIGSQYLNPVAQDINAQRDAARKEALAMAQNLRSSNPDTTEAFEAMESLIEDEDIADYTGVYRFLDDFGPDSWQEEFRRKYPLVSDEISLR